MCYYNGVKVTKSELIRLKSLEKIVAKYDFLNKPLISGFDYGNAPVLKRIEGREDFEIVEMEWGFLPVYVKNRDEAFKMRAGFKKPNGGFQPPIITLNAVSEEILKPGKIYREAALKSRCLVLSTGFFEWRHIFPANKKTGQPLKTAVKYPYQIGVKNKEYFFMAGIWQPWTDRSTGESVETFSIVTTAANKLMEQVHNTKKRMPTILTEDLAWEWIFGELDEKQIDHIARFQYPSEEMEAYSVAKNFREVLDPLEPFEYEDLPALEIA